MDDLDAYGRDYRPDDGTSVGDGGVRSGDRYVARHDPLRLVVEGEGGEQADVQLGVDPGVFYCADQLANLIELARARAVVTGLIHVPPDRSTGAAAAAAAHLHPRAATLEQCARVVAVALRGMADRTGEGAIVVTGFGPFLGVADNPTAAFVTDAAILERTVQHALPGARAGACVPLFTGAGGPPAHRRAYVAPDGSRALELVTAVLALAAAPADALAGRYFDTDTTARNFRLLIEAVTRERALAGVLSLGVDSGQARRAARPAFRVETQTRGFHQGSRGRTASDAFQRTLDLARIFLHAKVRGEGLLRGAMPAREA
jgi:hypothetical protein